MKMQWIFKASVAALLAVTPHMALAEWREAKTKHFHVYADMSEKALDEYIDALERYDAALRTLVQPRETLPLTIYIVSEVGDVQRLSRSSTTAGFYRPTYTGPYFVGPENFRGGETMTARSIFFHEYAHHILLSNADQFYPGWANEGLAEFFMSAKLGNDGSVTFGAPNSDRKYSMTGMSRWTAKDMLESDHRKLGRWEGIERYTRGWLMVHYLLLGGERNGQLTQYINRINAGEAPLKAGEAVFGDLNKLNSDLERYMRRSSIKTVTLQPKDFKTEAVISNRALSAGHAAIMPYRIQSASGVTEPEAKILAQRAGPVGAQYPNDAFVQRAMTEIYFDAKDYAAAEAAADRALAVEPTNVDALVYKGRIIALRAKTSGAEAEWNKARSLFLKANKAQPDNPLPFVPYYDSFVAQGKTPPEGALNGLLRAVVLVPQDDSLRLRATMAMINANDLKTARRLLAAVAFSGHRGNENPAFDLLEAIDRGDTKDQLLKIAQDKKFNLVNEFIDPPVENADKKDDKQKE
ncbi:hypothetical protein DMP17_07525 [Pseudonocardia sp. TMWB2A]|uniref:hypothetical protein n=1 Tax=Pseudonocardia sp. TMWB2A TaxID=687430 RepID=UPI00307E0119